MNISEAAVVSGLPVDVIRYYEKSSMMPRIKRGLRGWRHFDASAVEWLKILERLRETGMPMNDMRRFAELVFMENAHSAEATQERLDILHRHRVVIQARKAQLMACEAFVDMKIGIYTQQLEDVI